MGIYGSVALNAASSLQKNPASGARVAWQAAAANAGLTATCQIKGCPMDAFVGLAEVGLIVGTTAITRPKLGWNAIYAIAAVTLLKSSYQMTSRNPAVHLWNRVMSVLNKRIQHNSQMDVVISLWNAQQII